MNELPATLPNWALKRQRKEELQRPKFRRGDIVMVDNSKAEEVKLGSERGHFNDGLGVITEVSDNDYGIDFGPKKGESCWYPEETLTLVSSHIN